MAIIFRTGHVAIANPLSTLVDRNLQVAAFVDPNDFGSSPSVVGVLTFNGVQVASFGLGAIGNGFFQWTGLVPNAIQAGQAFTIDVSAHSDLGTETFRIEVDGAASRAAQLTFVVPSVTIDPFQSPLSLTQLPATLQLTGSASEGTAWPYGVSQVEYQIGSGPFTSVDPFTPGNSVHWTATVQVPTLGDTVITVRAKDPYGGTGVVQRTITVLQYQVHDDPSLPKTDDGQIPTTASITSWTRLEPQVANADMGLSSNARAFDPLWMMTRQWQMGEFQAEDAGTPVQARVRAMASRLTHIRYGEAGAPGAVTTLYSPSQFPLEALVERLPARATAVDDIRTLPLRVEAGLHFLHMLERQRLAQYRTTFVAQYALAPLSDDDGKTYAAADEETRRFVQTMGGRAIDGQRLADIIRPNPDPALLSILTTLGVATADQAAVLSAMRAWLTWFDGLVAEPGTQETWTPPRLEYAASVATRLSAASGDTVTLSTSEFDGGRLDWSSFDVEGNGSYKIDTSVISDYLPLNERTVPVSVTFPGAPAARFWEMEDAKVAYGLVPVGPTDLAHLMMIEYESSYGNDWYLVPLRTPVGSLTRVSSLVVTDTFGVRTLVRPIGDPALDAPHFSMWQQAPLRRAGTAAGDPVRNVFFLPPTIARSIDGPVLEDVLFARDEMANVAWAIERTIEGGVENAVPLTNGAAQPDAPLGGEAVSRYLLSSTVPANWIPLLPVQQYADPSRTVVLQRLQRGAVLQPDGSNAVHAAQSQVLAGLGSQLLYDEEVPREGVHITRRRRMVRWTNGESWVWTAYRNEVGTGEGSAGLVFDRLDPLAPAGALTATPVTIVASLATSDVVIGGVGSPYTATVDNPGPSLSGVAIQAWIVQGTTRRAAGGMLVDAGSGAAVLPSGECTISGTMVATNSGTGSGTLAPGDASLELQVIQGTGVVATTTIPVLLSEAMITALTPSPNTVDIDGVSTPYTATLVYGGASRSGVSLQGYVRQGTARRAVGAMPVDCGQGSGELVAGTFAISGEIVLTSGSPGIGTLVSGDAMFELQLVDASANVLTTSFVAVTVDQVPTIDALALASTIAYIDGPTWGYTVTLTNLGPTRSNVTVQGHVKQGSAVRDAGGPTVNLGGIAGEMHTGTFTLPYTLFARNFLPGTGTLVPGDATFELDLLVDGTVVDTTTVPLTLLPCPTFTALTPASTSLVIGGSVVPFSVTVDNQGPSISGLTLSGRIVQGFFFQTAGSLAFDVGSGPGVLPTGRFTISSTYFAANTNGGTGFLAPGSATFQVQLVGSGGQSFAAKATPVTLIPPPTITGLNLTTTNLVIGGASTPYAATLSNPGPSLSGLSLQGWIIQGTVHRATGPKVAVDVGSGSGVLPNASFPITGSASVSNSNDGTGTLAAGPATFQLQLLDATGKIIAKASVSVTLG